MAFKDIRFPEAVEFPFEGGPEFFTLVSATASGFEQRNINWEQARHKYSANHELESQDELDAIKDFFMVVRGRAFSFRFKDWADYFNDDKDFGLCSRVSDGGEVGNGTETEFQIRKQYKFGAGGATLTYNRNIYLPIDQSGLPPADIVVAEKVYIDDVEQTTGFTIARTGPDGTGGVITFTVPPAQNEVVEWKGEFDVPCRFGSDFRPSAIQHFQIGSVVGIEIVEVRPEENA